MRRKFLIFFVLASFALLLAGTAFAQGQALATPTIDANSVTATSFQPQWQPPSSGITIHPGLYNCRPNTDSRGRVTGWPNCSDWLYRFDVTLSESFAELDRRAARNNSSRIWEAKNNIVSVCSPITLPVTQDDRDNVTRRANCNFLQPNKTYSVWIRINGRNQNPDGGQFPQGAFVYKYYEPIEVTLGSRQGRAPGRPAGFRVASKSFTEIYLRWNPTADIGNYELNVNNSGWYPISPNHIREDNVFVAYGYTLGGNTARINFGPVIGNTGYSVGLRAVNDNGAGSAASLSVRTPKHPYGPRRPALAQPSGSDIGTDRVRLSWTHDAREDYANGVGPFRRYRVRVWTTDRWVGGFYTNSKSFTVTGLYPEATYMMNVYAEGPDIPKVSEADSIVPGVGASNTITVTTAAPPPPQTSTRDSQGSPGDQQQSSVGGLTSGSSNDQDSPPPQDPPPQPTLVPAPYTVPQSLIDTLLGYQAETHYGDDHVERWTRALAALGHGSHPNPMTLSEAFQKSKQHIAGRWDPVVDALQKLEG